MRATETAKEYIDAFLDLLYPSKTICYICSSSLEKNAKYSLCFHCYSSLPFIPLQHCTKCSKVLRMTEDSLICEECEKSLYFFDRALSVVRYEGDVKKLIYRFKYSRHTYLAKTIGEMMAHKLKQEGLDIDIIIPIPLYKAKEKERGFNQAYLISKYISKNTNIPLNIYCLIRTKNTKAMHNLSKRERQENVKDAFKVIQERVIVNRNILLVDDIFTTGATANVCSKIFKKSGAKTVTVLTFARD